MLVDFDPSPELEQAAQRAMVCAPHLCEREVHCARLATAMRDLFRQAYAQGWDGRQSPAPPAIPTWEATRTWITNAGVES